MGYKSEPINLQHIQEGRVARKLDRKIQAAARAIIEHYKEHEDDKAKATVTLEVEFSKGKGDHVFAVRTRFKDKFPGDPDDYSMAIADHDAETDEETLFVRPSGSTQEDPRQMRLATEDGRAIDTATGKIKDKE